MEQLYQIYLITNILNNKKYIGQTIKSFGYKKRFKAHLYNKRSSCFRLDAAIKHYGVENFKVELVEDDIPQDLIDEKERYYIDLYNTFYKNGFGYNMTLGGQGVHGYVHTPETKQKMSLASKKAWELLYENPDKLYLRNQKISKAQKGRPKTEEQKIKYSEAAKKRFENSPGTFLGKTHTQQTRDIISLKNGLPIEMIDKDTGEILQTFNSVMKATKYLLDNNYTKNKGAFSRILSVCRGNKGAGVSAYGFKWKLVNK